MSAGRHNGGGVYEQDTIQRLSRLRQEHRDLEAEIDALAFGPGADQMTLARLKKRKLALKDEIAVLLDQIVPDIIA
ncbi:MAG: DUF465 domain-containing protein [Sphingomonas fennica]